MHNGQEKEVVKHPSVLGFRSVRGSLSINHLSQYHRGSQTMALPWFDLRRLRDQKLENVATNDALPLKVAQRDEIFLEFRIWAAGKPNAVSFS